MWPYCWHLKHCFCLHAALYNVNRCNSAPIARPSSIAPFVCIAVLHSITNNDFFFPWKRLVGHPIHLISKPGIEASFFAHIFSIVISLWARSIESTRTALTTTPKVLVMGFAPFPKTSVQQSFCRSFLVLPSFAVYTAISPLFSLRAARMSVSVMFFDLTYWLILSTIFSGDWLSKARALLLSLSLIMISLALL